MKKPKPLIKEQLEKKSMDTHWPDILNFVEKNPDCTNETLFNMFNERTGDLSPIVFQRKCNNRGLKEFRKEIQGKKGGRFKESKKVTEKVIESFKQDRLNRGVLHLSKMDIMMNRAHNVLDKESIAVLNNTKDNVGIGIHLSHLNQAHRLAKDVYKIDADDRHDSSKVNLAIIMQFDPAKAVPSDERVVTSKTIDI